MKQKTWGFFSLFSRPLRGSSTTPKVPHHIAKTRWAVTFAAALITALFFLAVLPDVAQFIAAKLWSRSDITHIAPQLAQVKAGVEMQKEAYVDPNPVVYEVNVPANIQPPVFRANEVNIPPETEVMGVSSGAEHRAYLLEALSEVEDHVVNDLLQSTPISVSFCDLSRCARVFTSEMTSGQPLDLRVAGATSNRELMLLYKGREHNQMSKKIPLRDYDYQLTTWARWSALHAQTTVFIGQLNQFKRDD